MPHEKNKIRVKRKGKGHGKVTTDPEDEMIGEAPATLTWIKRPKSDPEPGEDFSFDLNAPLTNLADPPFKVLTTDGDTVTVAYAGSSSSSRKSWKYKIHVTDVSADSDCGRILSDGSATIKNK